jgi:hypothetical protein
VPRSKKRELIELMGIGDLKLKGKGEDIGLTVMSRVVAYAFG